MLEYALATGIIFGLYFALVGVGMNLVFGVMRIVNLAHGDIIMLGAFAAFYLFRTAGLPPPAVITLAFLAFFLVGLPLYYLLIPRLNRAREPEMLSLILFFGLSQTIEALAALFFGNTERSIPSRLLGGHPIPLLGQTIPYAWAYAATTSVFMLAAVYLYLYRTRIGRQTRAIMADRDEALAIGIDIHRISAIAFATGIGLAAIAGVFAPFMLGSFTPSIGIPLDLTSFAVIIIGSLGNPLGAILGGIIFGLSLMLMRTYLSSLADLLPNLVLIAVLLTRPNGLLGRRIRNA